MAICLLSRKSKLVVDRYIVQCRQNSVTKQKPKNKLASCGTEGLQFLPIVAEACGGSWGPTALQTFQTIAIAEGERQGCSPKSVWPARCWCIFMPVDTGNSVPYVAELFFPVQRQMALARSFIKPAIPGSLTIVADLRGENSWTRVQSSDKLLDEVSCHLDLDGTPGHPILSERLSVS